MGTNGRLGTGAALLVMAALVGCSSSGDGGEAWRDDAGAIGLRDSSTRWDGGWSGSDGGYPAQDAGSYAPYDASSPPPGADASVAPDASVPDDASVADAGDADVDLCTRRESREPLELYLSADDSNSMASPVIARRLIEQGRAAEPWPAAGGWLRTYEFLNYYNVSYGAPEQGHLTVVPEMRPGETDSELVLQIGAQSAPAPEPVQKVITLVLDTSGSMGGRPMELERAAVRALAASLDAGDIVSAVEWSTVRTVPLEAHVVSGPNDPQVLDLADSLESGGGTDLHGGLTHGYDLAQAHYDPNKLNRVVLISDGQANAGITSKEIIADAAEDSERAGIYLTGVGVGDGVNDTLMDAVTDEGRGAYLYLDDAAEAEHMFGDRFDEVMKVALMSVRVRLTLPWYMEMREFHGEEYSTSPQEVKPQHIAPDDAMVFHQILEACDPSEISTDDPVSMEATYVRPGTYEEAADGLETTIGEMMDAAGPTLARGDAIVAYAEALADAEELKRAGDRAAARTELEAALAMVEAADPEGTDPELSEIASLLGAYLDQLP